MTTCQWCKLKRKVNKMEVDLRENGVVHMASKLTLCRKCVGTLRNQLIATIYINNYSKGTPK